MMGDLKSRETLGHEIQGKMIAAKRIDKEHEKEECICVLFHYAKHRGLT
jgi:hypothetical protein